MLRLLPPEAWSRTGRHLTLGPTTLREQVRIFAAHTEEHIAQIVGLRDVSAADITSSPLATPRVGM